MSVLPCDIKPEQLIGKKLKIAMGVLDMFGMKYRITRIDGDYLIVTRDYDPGRFNLQVDDGIVTTVGMG
jgi:hypothetical protein